MERLSSLHRRRHGGKTSWVSFDACFDEFPFFVFFFEAGSWCSLIFGYCYCLFYRRRFENGGIAQNGQQQFASNFVDMMSNR